MSSLPDFNVLDPLNLGGGKGPDITIREALDPGGIGINKNGLLEGKFPGSWGSGGGGQGMTPQEQLAYNEAQPYLQEYNSGVLDPANQALVNQGDTNQTAAALQSFANAGMSNSTSQFALTGNVTPGSKTGGFQAGAGSAIDVQKATETQQILQQDLSNAMAYLGVAAGDANAMTQLNLNQNAEVVSALGAASSAFGDLLGNQGIITAQQQQLDNYTASYGADNYGQTVA